MGNFLFINVADKQAQVLSSVLANKTCRVILEVLKTKPITESDLAKELSMPISTVHYNIQQLLKAGLVVGDQYTYSKKGKEMVHYRLTDKFIVIAPQASALEDVLKSLVPALGIIAAGSLFISKVLPTMSAPAPMQAQMMMIAEESVAMDSALAMDSSVAMAKSAPLAMEVAPSEPNVLLIYIALSIVVFGILWALMHILLHFKRS